MIRYSKYLFLNVIRKKLLWLLLFFSVAIAIIVVYLQVHEFEKRSAKFAGSINTVTKIFPFIFGVSFMSLIIIYVFKDGESDGTELMIVSKPLKRSDILLGKFSILLIGIIFYNLFVFLTYISVVQFDTVSSSSERIKFASSLSVGGLIIITIATSIIVLMASFVGKIGTLSIGIVAATLVPITSSIISDVSKGKPSGRSDMFNSHIGIINLKQLDELVHSKVEKELKDDPGLLNRIIVNPKKVDLKKYKNIFLKKDLLNIGTRSFNPIEPKHIKRFNTYIDKVWYGIPAYVDPWYQWGKFYDIFTGTNPFFDNTPKKWVLEKNTQVMISDKEALEKTTLGINMSISVNLFSANTKNIEGLLSKAADILVGAKKVMIFSNEAYGNDPKHDGLISWAEVPKMLNTTKTNAEFKTQYGEIPVVDVFKNKKYSFETRARAIMASMRTYSYLSSMNSFTTDELLLYKMVLAGVRGKWKTALHNKILKNLYPFIMGEIKVKYPNFDIKTLMYKAPDNARSFSKKGINNSEIKSYIKQNNHINEKTQLPITLKDVQDAILFSDSSPLLITGDSIATAHTEPFIKSNSVVIIWSVLGSLLVLITIWRYTRRDFK